MTIQGWQKKIHRWAIGKGWWKKGHEGERPAGELFMNISSEISEAWEEWRKAGFSSPVYYENGKPEGVGIELADAVIRTLDLCEAYGIDLEEMIRIKHEYNKTRPFRHGNKLA